MSSKTSPAPVPDRASPAGRSPVALLLPLRLFGEVVLSSLMRMFLYAAAGSALMIGAALLLGGILPDAGIWSALGRWSLVGVYAVIGLVGGALWGLNAASSRAIAAFEEQTVTMIGLLTPANVEELIPQTPLAQLHAKYDHILDEMVEQTFGRARLPRVLRHLLKERMRQAVIDAFLEDCAERGVESVGFAEVRDWLLRRGVPLATAPARMSIRFWRYVLVGAWVVVIGGTVALALPSTWPAIGAALPGSFVALGLLTIVFALPRARLHLRPARWRVGILVLGVALAAWPAAYVRLARADTDLGMVWVVVLTATFLTFSYGVRQALIEADRPV